MQRDADEIFRVKDLSMLKSPLPIHLRAKSSPGTPAGSTGMAAGLPAGTISPTAVMTPGMVRPSPMLMRPTPKPMAPPPARPRMTPVVSSVTKSLASSGMGTPMTASKPAFPLTMTPLSRKGPVVDLDSSLVAEEENHLDLKLHEEEKNDGLAQNKEEKDETLEELHKEHECLAEDTAPLPTEEDSAEKDELRDMIFKDIVDETKLEGHQQEPEVSVQSTVAAVDPKAEVAPVDTQPTSPTRKRTWGRRSLTRRATAPLSVDEAVRKALDFDGEEKENAVEETKTIECVAADKVSAGGETKATGTVESEKDQNKTPVAMAPTAALHTPSTAMPVAASTVANSKECTLDQWYLQKIPNNPKFSGVERSTCPEWIVLVGIKKDNGELWHSSIVSGRESSKRILTASGKIYNLLSLDSAAMLQSGFSKTLTARLARGFSEAWKEHLIQELGIHQQEPEEEETQELPKQLKSSPPRTSSKTTAVPKTSSLKTPLKRQKSVGSSARKARTPKNQTVSTPKLAVETPRVLGSTRSGRKIVTPLPFWDNQAVAAFKPSPTLQLKRRWGA